MKRVHDLSLAQVNNCLVSYIEFLNVIKNNEMKKIASVFIISLLLVACSNTNAYNISGKMGDGTWDGKQVTLLGISAENVMTPIDSTIIKGGEFTLKGKVDSAGWYVLLLKNDNGQPTYKDFYAEGDLDFSVKNGKIRITGGPLNDAYQAFGDKYEEMTISIVRLNAELKANPGNAEIEKAFNDEYVLFAKNFRELAISTITKNRDNPVGLHIFQTTMSALENEDIESILTKATPEFLADPTVKMVKAQLELSRKTTVGKKFADLTMFKPDNSPISLSEYAGKGSYVLIDFWASWCGPCMRELPNVLACYDKYHKKGFEIVGVSLDEDAEAWKAAIKKHKMPWPQMSDLAGWNSKAVAVYSFSGIPHTVLIDPQGIIIAKDLRGAALGQKLSELLDK